MCLAIPGEVCQIEGQEAIVELGGVKRKVRLDLLPEEVNVGDYLLIHTGFAIRKILAEETEATLKLYDELIQASAQNDEASI